MTPSCHHSVTFINYGPTRTNETLPGPQLSKWRLPGTADGLAFRAGWVFIFPPRSQGKRVRVQESLSRGARLPSLPKCLPCGAGRRISHCTAPHTHLTQLWKALGGSGRLLASRWGHREVPCMKGVYNPLANRQESRPGLHRGFPGQIQQQRLKQNQPWFWRSESECSQAAHEPSSLRLARPPRVGDPA